VILKTATTSFGVLLNLVTNGTTTFFDVSNIRQEHNSNSSDHYLLDIFIAGLNSWFKGSTHTPDRYPHRYHRLIAEQAKIGWRPMFNGHLSLEWRTK
jgi:hypothetical protein